MGRDDERFARAYNGSLGAKPPAARHPGAEPLVMGPLKLKDIHFFDAQRKAKFGATENAGPGQCRTWKMTDQFAGLENVELENDGPNRRAGKCKTWKMTDHVAGGWKMQDLQK